MTWYTESSAVKKIPVQLFLSLHFNKSYIFSVLTVVDIILSSSLRLITWEAYIRPVTLQAVGFSNTKQKKPLWATVCFSMEHARVRHAARDAFDVNFICHWQSKQVNGSSHEWINKFIIANLISVIISIIYSSEKKCKLQIKPQFKTWISCGILLASGAWLAWKLTTFDMLKFSIAARLRGHKQRKLNDHIYSFLLCVSCGPRYQAEF